MNIQSFRCLALAQVLLLLGSALTAPAQVPRLLHYQGRAQVKNAQGQFIPFTGTSGKFKFALVNTGGTETYWSNDGSSTGGSEPQKSVTLPVAGSLFDVLLGNGMNPVTPSVFTHSDVRLRVWFDDGAGHGFQVMPPDDRILPVGYALQAAGIADGRTPGVAYSQDANPGGTRFLGTNPLDSLTMQVSGKGSVLISAFVTFEPDRFGGLIALQAMFEDQSELELFCGGELVKAAATGRTHVSQHFGRTLHVSWVLQVNPGPLSLNTSLNHFNQDIPASAGTTVFYGHNLTAIYVPDP